MKRTAVAARDRGESERLATRATDAQTAIAAVLAEYIDLKERVARSRADHARLEAATLRAIERIRRRSS